MASACAAISTAPRLSFSQDFSSCDGPESNTFRPEPASDFEFLLHEPASVITADELFSNGKLIPLQPSKPLSDPDPDQDSPSPDSDQAVALVPSPRPPMCTSRWKDLLRLKRAKAVPVPSKNMTGSNSNPNPNPRVLRFLLKKSTIPKPPSDQLLNSPLLPSGSDPDESANNTLNPPKIRLVRRVPPQEPGSNPDPDQTRSNRAPLQQPSVRSGASIDSPRLNAAGKVVFTGLERSSSSPGSFSDEPRVKYRGIERSYSANVNGVRIAPVLNVPVCSLRGSRKSVSVFGFERIFKGERRERSGSVPASRASAGKGKNEVED